VAPSDGSFTAQTGNELAQGGRNVPIAESGVVDEPVLLSLAHGLRPFLVGLFGQLQPRALDL
jgi:hypothetical protein